LNYLVIEVVVAVTQFHGNTAACGLGEPQETWYQAGWENLLFTGLSSH